MLSLNVINIYAFSFINIDIFEWIGYIASALVLISLLMSSIVKLRWINLAGSIVFCVYGFLIGALPVAFMNFATMIINIYYLFKIYSTKEFFKIMPIEKDSSYLNYFLDFYGSDIKKIFEQFDFNMKDDKVGFFILRNMVPAGIFLGVKSDERTLNIDLDFVIPEYRDLKIGKYLFDTRKDFFISHGFDILLTTAKNKKHREYLKKMGFEPLEKDSNEYKLRIEDNT